MSARLASGLVVNALVRRAAAAGGIATVLAKGDADAGAILIVTVERGVGDQLWERVYGPDGKATLVATGPASPQAITDYWQRRRAQDRDVWVIELDIASGERFAAETICAD